MINPDHRFIFVIASSTETKEARVGLKTNLNITQLTSLQALVMVYNWDLECIQHLLLIDSGLVFSSAGLLWGFSFISKLPSRPSNHSSFFITLFYILSDSPSSSLELPCMCSSCFPHKASFYPLVWCPPVAPVLHILSLSFPSTSAHWWLASLAAILSLEVNRSLEGWMPLRYRWALKLAITFENILFWL